MLKFHQRHGRFPHRVELPGEVVEFVAKAVKVPAAELRGYEWDGRTSKYHRTQIRRFTGFRECAVADADKATGWLVEQVCCAERRPERVRAALLAYLRDERIEPPATIRLSRMIASALEQSEQSLTRRICARVAPEALARMLALIAQRASEDDDSGDDDDDEQTSGQDATPEEGADAFAAVRHEPGGVSIKTITAEVRKLQVITTVGLSEDLFDDIAPGVLLAWRSRVAAEAPSHLREHPHEITVTLLAAYLHCRRREIIDTLVDLLITTVHRINARADTVVTGEFVAELKRVSGKENILFKMTGAALEAPNRIVSEVIYPAVPGGVDTLTALWQEYHSKGSTYRQHRQRVFKASYTHHYRAGLIQILDALEFGSTNTAHAPMMTALALIKRYRTEHTHHTHHTQYYALAEEVPVEEIVPVELAELMYRTDKRGRRRGLRSVYECGVFQSLREQLRCKETWVHGATSGATPTSISRKTSRTNAPRTTPRCASRARPAGSPPSWPRSTTPCPAWTGCASSRAKRARSC